jgi:hypothetical protein
MDAAGVGGSGGARFEVYLTTKAQPTAFRRALAIDGENLGVTVDQRLNAAAGLEGNGVCVGWDAGGLGYAFPYESVGVNSAIYNLRLQSPNQIFFHTANQQRGGIDQAGTFRLTGSAAIAGNIGTAGRDPVSGLPTGWGGGVHTWDVYAEGTIGIGPGNGAVLASLGNDGTVSGVRKPFVIDHPLGEDRHLVHAAIEGPEYGVYYRGEGRLEDGRATITLPRYFEALCREQGRSAQLTPKVEPGADPPGVLGVTEVRDGQFGVVAGQGCAPDQAFFWEVKAVRTDVDVLIPEPLRSENPIIVAMARRGDERNARADAGPARGAAGGVEQRGPSPATAGAGGGADA